MIDTIVLTLNESQFKVLDHNRFSPSTEGLFNSSYYRMGARGNIICKQNPTSSELKLGIYKPRLSVTKRFNKKSEFEITMKIEFSIPKLLYGNNFDEVEEKDFPLIIKTLKNKLKDMGVFVFERFLEKALVSSVHYSKNIALVDGSIPYMYLEMLRKINLNQRLDLNQTDFRNEGHSVKYRANSFEIVFYDKKKDLNKAKISEKRAEEKDNSPQLNLFENLKINKPFEVIRMEVRLNKRQKIRQIFKNIEYKSEPIFKSVFQEEVSKNTLLHFLKQIEQGSSAFLMYSYKNPKDFLSVFITHNPEAGLRKAIQMLGLKMLFDKVGIRETREIIKKYGNGNWYRLNKEIKQLDLPVLRNVFSIIKEAIENFKPLKLLDFEAKMLNNDNIR